MTEDPNVTIEELREEVARLQGILEKQAQRREQLFGEAVGWGGRLLVGGGLRRSFREWFETASTSNPVPPEETAGVLAAVVRRVVRVGALTVLLAVGPSVLAAGFYVWHTMLLQTQIEQQAANTILLQNQMDQQAADTLIVRRAQLLATLYEEDKGSCEEVAVEDASHPRSKRKCQPLASARARQEAARAFVQIERPGTIDLSRAFLSSVDLSSADLTNVLLVRADLTDANLAGTLLAGADLTKANLSGANLNQVNLYRANLSRADLNETSLKGANLTKANLNYADLYDANLIRADLSGANLRNADLSESILYQADLSEADLRGANLGRIRSTTGDFTKPAMVTQIQINQAEGDHTTILPEGLTYPDHWLEKANRKEETLRSN